jgi:carbonic anhydrase/acetyltransferase-like protein (isoleucine patch superfamily)
MLIKPVHGIMPKFGERCYFAENATVVGQVEMGNECSVWFNAVVRGDVHYIKMGNRVNVQDGAVIHCTYQKYAVEIGNNVSIGHNAIVHGCTISDNVLIGMGAIIMDGCFIGSNSIIAAGAVVTQGTHVSENVIFGGIPGKKIKDISPELTRDEIERIAKNYMLVGTLLANSLNLDKMWERKVA